MNTNHAFLLSAGVLALSSALGCGDSTDDAGGGGTTGDCGTPGALPVAAEPTAVFSWLQSGAYAQQFEAEPAAHTSSGPHGIVRTFVDSGLAASLRAGNAEHPQGSVAVKELYSGTDLRGWAVMVKADSCSQGGQGWYFYEVFSTTDGANPAADERGASGCAPCHSSGADFIRTAWP